MNKPIILSESDEIEQQLASIRGSKPKELDFYKQQIQELFEITHPDRAIDENELSKFIDTNRAKKNTGTWVYYPWSNTLTHIVNEDIFYKLRTNRNRHLITTEEQMILRTKRVGVVGMSVGSYIAIGCAYSGIANTIKIADADFADTTNMNRLQVGVQDLYTNKAILAARKIYEADPFMEVEIFEENITKQNVEQFMMGKKPLDIIVDEIDDFKMKVELRIKAKELKIPLLMMTSIGDKILVDVERYDIDATTKPFLGKANEAVEKLQSDAEITEDDIKRYSVELVERKHVSERALQSVKDIGGLLKGRPQLFSTVSASDGVAVMVIRELILNNLTINSGRYLIDLSDALT